MQEKFKNQKGISLVEVMIVIVIISVLVVISVAQFGNSETRFQVQNVARELKINLERARYDSVKRRPSNTTDMARVTINSATSFSLTIDLDQDGTIGSKDIRTIDISNSDIKIISSSVNYPVTVMFNRQGQITSIDSSGSDITPDFRICENCTSSNAASSEGYKISVSATGTVSMLRNNESSPTFLDPTTSSVSNTSDVNPLMNE